MTFGTFGVKPADYNSTMGATERLFDRVKWLAGLTWVAVGLPELLKFHPNAAPSADPGGFLWVVAFLIFGPAFWASGSIARARKTFSVRLAALGVATASAFAMLYLKPSCYAEALLVVVAWQAALLLPTLWVFVWIGIQAAMIFIFYQWISPVLNGWAIALIYLAFQLYAFLTAHVAKSETQARHEMVRINAELKATQLLLAQSTRIGERTRISRELHDVMGHDLTALSLHIEVALNSPSDSRQPLVKARSLATGLLQKVRNIVSLMRPDNGTSLIPMLRALAADAPQLQIHLDVVGDIEVTDPGPSHTLLRCVQEIITNARTHSGGSNLWLSVLRDGADIVVRAHDDGHGDPQLCFGRGLNGMKERLEEFGGSLIAKNVPHRGITLDIRLPLGMSTR